MECSLRDRIKNGIIKNIANTLLSSNLFTQSGNDFTAIGNDTSIVNNINDSFGENIVYKEGDLYKLNISEQLIDKYETAKLGFIKIPFKSLSDKDINDIMTEVGINENTTIEEYIQQSLTDTPSILKKANPDVKLNWSREKQSSYDSSTNTVNISLDEVKYVSLSTGIPLKQSLDFLVGHEVTHATTYFALRKGQNDVQLSKIREKLIKLHQSNPFVDTFRLDYIGEDGLPYSLKNVDEMVADSTHNPFFAEWLKSHKDEDGQTFFQKIINRILEWFGIVKPSYYDEILEIITNERFYDDNYEGVIDADNNSPMILVELYGLPKTHAQAAYEFFTSTSVKDEVREVLKDLPNIMTKLKSKMDNELDKDRKKSISSLYDSFTYSKDDEGKLVSSLNMILQAAEYSRDLITRINELENIEDNDRKLAMGWSIHQAAQSLEVIEPYIADIMSELQKADTKLLRDFRNQISAILGTRLTVVRTYNNLVREPIVDTLSEPYSDNGAITELENLIKNLENKKNQTDSLKEKELYASRIESARKKIEKIPSKKYFKDLFNGQGIDASAYEMYLNAPIANSNNLVASVQDMIQKANQKISQNMINVANSYQTNLDNLKKALGVKEITNVNEFYKPILDEVEFITEVEEDENGTLKPSKTITQKMLLSEYDSKYIKDYYYKNTVIEYYFQKLKESTKIGDDKLSEKYENLLNEAKKDKYEFEEKNSERRYVDKVYQMYKLFDKELNDNGRITTLGKERGKLFEQIAIYEKIRDTSADINETQHIQEAINELRGEIQQLSSLYDKDGNLKTGFHKELADVAIEYKKLRNEYGTYVLTDMGRALFEDNVMKLKKLLSEQRITQEQYNSRLSDISVVTTTDEFKDIVRVSRENIKNLADKIAKIPDYGSFFDKEDKTIMTEGFDKLTAITSPFRDDDFVVDGITFSKNRANLIPEVKKIQESIQKMSENSQKLKSLSMADSNRMRELKALKQRTLEEENELKELGEKLDKIRANYEKNKALIDQYTKAVSNYSSLYENKETGYYDRESSLQYNNYLALKKKEIAEKISKITSMGSFRKIDGEWFKVINRDNKEVYQALDNKAFASNEDAAIFNISKEIMDVEWYQTEWYKNNHYDRVFFSYKDKKFITESKPIYIWTQSIPKDEKFILKNQPSIKFKTYKINDENINKNFKVLNDNIPSPKSSVYRNERYEKLKQDKKYFDFLEFVRADYYNVQAGYPPEKRMYDVLPSLVKTNDEIQSDLFSSFSEKATKLMAFNLSIEKGTDDENVVTGGSTSSFYAKNKIIPIRFAGKLDKSKQSSDITAMLLAFNIASLEYSEYMKLQPILEGIRSVIDNTEVLESKNIAAKFNIPNLLNFFNNRIKKKTTVKEVKQSNLSKNLNFVIDTYLYGETKTESHGVIMGLDVDFHKMSSNLKRVSSFSIFALNAFSGIKNSVTSTITGYINSNIAKGYYSAADYSKGHAEAILLTKDLVADFNKFGNKSKIGQELDYFQILQGAFYNMYGKKTAYSSIKNIESFLTLPKASSEIEIQIAQYLAMSKANPVEVDGKMVEFREAFEIKDGIFKKKDGANISQKDIDKFINRVLYINRTINGAYREMEKNAMNKNVLGSLANYLNGYLVTGILGRFGNTQYAVDGQMLTRGFHMDTLQLLGDLVKYRQGLATTWHTLSEEEKLRVHRSLREIFAVIAIGLLAFALGADDGKKELENNSAMQNWLIAITLGVKSELETFIPLPGFGLNELARKMNSPFAALRQVTGIIKLVENFSLFIFDSDKAYYKATGIRDGFHDKGDAKFVANFLKLVGYSGAGMNVIDKIQQIKQSQQLR